MRKIYFILVILIVSGLAALYLHQHRSSTFYSRDTGFNLPDQNKIDRINIASGLKILSIVHVDGSWSIDNEPVNQERISDLLVLASKLEVKSPAAKSDEKELTEKLKSGTKISYYSGKKLIRSYRICKWNWQLFACLHKSDKIFQVEARGYPNVDLTKVMNTDISYWLDHKIFSIQPENIRLVKIQYPGNPNNDFVLKQIEPGKYQLSDQNNIIISSADKELMILYLHFFQNIGSQPVQDYEKQDTSNLKEPFFNLVVETNNKDVIELTGYRKNDRATNQLDIVDFFGKQNNNKVVNMNYSDIDPILMELKDFLKK